MKTERFQAIAMQIQKPTEEQYQRRQMAELNGKWYKIHAAQGIQHHTPEARKRYPHIVACCIEDSRLKIERVLDLSLETTQLKQAWY